ncbi:MAG: hypothetical protein JNK23_20095 [Opitutaceae bacterium]|nr:hypothetical protein [Opitutaceae bacterium]
MNSPHPFFVAAILATAGLAAQTAPETAQAALARGDHAAAIAALDPHLRAQPDDVPALFLRSVAAERAGDLAAAVLFSGRALETQRRLQPDAKPFAPHLARHRDLFDRLVAAHPAPASTPAAPRPTAPAPSSRAPSTGPAASPGAPASGLQWAVAAKASSEYRATNYGANQAVGAPNVRAYGDSGSAWAPKTENAGAEWIELTYAAPVRATGARVIQSFNPGAIVQIDFIDAAGAVAATWHGPDTATYPAGRIGVLEIKLPAPAPAVTKLKVILDTKRVRGWNAIDAVALLGEP